MLLADRILYIDAEAIVLDKPAGLPVDAPRDGGLAVENYLDTLRFGFHRRPAAVHRLDRDTSGCLLLARNPKALTRFGAAFEAGEVRKAYLAVVDGVPAESAGTIYQPLAKVSTAQDGWRIVPDRKGKPATTDWEIVEVIDGRALLRLRPRTGRTHQLRVHAASGIGLPIVGDPIYGRSGPAMLLHAARIVVPRGTKAAIDVTAALPERFGAFAHEPADAAA